MLEQAIAGFSSWMLVLLVALCIALLSKGADWLVDGVVDLAQRTRMPRIVIGATIVSLGTTLPEAFVSVMAAYMGNPGLALGNGVGSIIVDTGLIFGLTILLARVPVNRFILNRTGWVQVGAVTLLVVIAFVALLRAPEGTTPVLERWVGFLFLLLLGLYLYLTYHWARQSEGPGYDSSRHQLPAQTGLGKSWLMVFGGLFLVVAGARVLIPSVSEIAHRLSVPDDVIAATMVAFGTSVPELTTAIASVRKGYPEIMVGNIVGADVLNCFFVIGAAAVAAPLDIPSNFYIFHFPAVLIILYSFRLFISGNRAGIFYRWQGGWLLSVYAGYVALQYMLNMGSVHG